ncbi:hypothetical protein R1flu_007458 [Riccia fluitans]|uniref:Peroxidase n=1 Tax=Riccia fluitans TaxID=41844 RepID=A0ABD1Z1L5_9MARC
MDVNYRWALVAFSVLLMLQTGPTSAQILGFYDMKCPRAESLVSLTVQQAVARDPTMAASIVRMHFHDCWVEGCDASVLLDSSPAWGPAEKEAGPNQSLRGFEVFDAAKAAVEAVCPGIVSCADIIALAARDAIVAVGGPTWQVPTGRRDGTTSTATSAGLNIPSSLFTYSQLLMNFLNHGFSEDEMITLSGAHTIGRAHCSAFMGRLYPTVDPSLDPAYAAQLKARCLPGGNPGIVVPLDPGTPDIFDNSYYLNLGAGRGLMPSDAALLNSGFSTSISQQNGQNGQFWTVKFANAMQRMGMMNLKLGLLGEIRTNCRVRN